MNKRVSERGGSMVWVAVLMLAVPPMLLTLVNGARLLRASYEVRGASYTACQAALERALDLRAYRQSHKVVIDADKAQATASVWFWAALKFSVRRGIIEAPAIQISIGGPYKQSLRCKGQAYYRLWGVNGNIPLHFTVQSQVSPSRQ